LISRRAVPQPGGGGAMALGAEAQALSNMLLTMEQEQATSVISKLLLQKPELAPTLVTFACPELTYAPSRAMEERRAMGTLKSFSSKNGFGFIACPELQQIFGMDVFIHVKQLGCYAAVLNVGMPVTFAVVLNKDNKPQAYDVQPMDGSLMSAALDGGMGGGMGMGGMDGSWQGGWDGWDGGFDSWFGGMGGCQGPMGMEGKGKGKTGGGGGGVKRKMEDPDCELGRFRGRIKSFNAEKGFGFIVCEDLQKNGYTQDVFLHSHQVAGCQAGQPVQFTAFMNEKDQPQAKDLEPDWGQ